MLSVLHVTCREEVLKRINALPPDDERFADLLFVLVAPPGKTRYIYMILAATGGVIGFVAPRIIEFLGGI
jgi:hypothetical protein